MGNAHVDAARGSRRDGASAARATAAGGANGDAGTIHLGYTLPGFAVAEINAPKRLELRGGHRFSNYALVFELDATNLAGCTLRAQTWAEFPGLTGRAYRALVIGSRGHRVVVRRMLRRVARRA
jgi:hypothetical protein